MQICINKVEENNLTALLTFEQLDYFVILSNLAMFYKFEGNGLAWAYETIKKATRQNPDDLYWTLLDLILESPLFPIPLDWQDYIVERTEEIDYVIYKILTNK